jgi:hypothetical protein
LTFAPGAVFADEELKVGPLLIGKLEEDALAF